MQNYQLFGVQNEYDIHRWSLICALWPKQWLKHKTTQKEEKKKEQQQLCSMVFFFSTQYWLHLSNFSLGADETVAEEKQKETFFFPTNHGKQSK